MKRTRELFLEILKDIYNGLEGDFEAKVFKAKVETFIDALLENEQEAQQWVKMRNTLDNAVLTGLWNKKKVN